MNIVGFVIVMSVLAFSITLHEFMHAFISLKQGDDTARLLGRVSLNPLRHIDPLTTVILPLFLFLAGLPVFAAAKPVPINPSRLRDGDLGAALVAVAGPLTNLGIAVILGLWLRFMAVPELVFDIFRLTVGINLALFVFNMIPYPPLDGSRLLYAFAPDPLRRLMLQIESLGFAGIAFFMFFIVGFLGEFIARAVFQLGQLILPGVQVF